MLPYWLLFALLAAIALAAHRPRAAEMVAERDLALPESRPQANFPFLVIGLLIALMIGIRWKVGGDWFAYVRMYDQASVLTLGQQVGYGDPGYQFLNWITQQLDIGLWFVNFVCGLIFTWGLVRLCRIQREPWLALLVAIPYCVIVVAMGYTRQATAMGFLMAGLAGLLQGRGGLLRFGVYVLVAATFHKTAIVIFPVVALAFPRNRIMNFLVAAAFTAALYSTFVSNDVDRLIGNYVTAQYSSSGAAIRLAQSAIPAILLFVLRRRLVFSVLEWRLWRNFAIASLVMTVLLVTTPSSTAVDRIALYLLPLQFVVLARLPGSFVSVLISRLLIVAYLATSLWVWLRYATNAPAWLPYQTWFAAP